MKLRNIALVSLCALLVLYGVCGKPPNVPDKPRGPAEGMKGVALACTTQTNDPGGSKVAYQFDWGDGSEQTWSSLMEGDVPHVESHAYTEAGNMEVRARAKNEKGKVSDWSEALRIYVRPGEGEVLWYVGYPDPEALEDSADFSSYTFAIGSDSTAHVASEGFGVLLGRRTTGSPREFYSPDADDFAAAPALDPQGTVYIACGDELLYCINPDYTRRWTAGTKGEVSGCAAIAEDGTVFVQTDDSLFAFNPSGGQSWAYYNGGGGSSPVIGPDGSVYAGTQDGLVYSLKPTGEPKWPAPYVLGTQEIVASPAINAGLGAIYVADEGGYLASIDLATGSENWKSSVGESPSSPVIGPDGVIYIGAGGKLLAVNPTTGGTMQTYSPTLQGAVSTPAVSSAGYVYFLVTQGKDFQDDPDSLYGINAGDFSRRWACGLGFGAFSDRMSAPKIGPDGSIYIGSGLRAWCVGAVGGPADSPWPVFQHDAMNSGRAR